MKEIDLGISGTENMHLCHSDADRSFEASDEDILAVSLPSGVLEQAGAAREKVFRCIAERIGMKPSSTEERRQESN